MNRVILPLFLLPLAGFAQIDQQRAAEAFNQAKTLCEREGGKLWKISLCGPIVIADPATKTIATNQPAPEAPWPAALGFANSWRSAKVVLLSRFGRVMWSGSRPVKSIGTERRRRRG